MRCFGLFFFCFFQLTPIEHIQSYEIVWSAFPRQLGRRSLQHQRHHAARSRRPQHPRKFPKIKSQIKHANAKEQDWRIWLEQDGNVISFWHDIPLYPDVADKIRDGKVAATGALIGAVMKEMRGQADAGRVRELILEKLT